MMGFEHFSREEMHDWKVEMWVMRERARRAGSGGREGGGGGGFWVV